MHSVQGEMRVAWGSDEGVCSWTNACLEVRE